ncbi:MAG: hypothetical protein LBS59_01515 [Puniceicoccales bacterium]|jgi:hypothetical protein|nr:hypothetical protein [Puniceicoccales bacterium]
MTNTDVLLIILVLVGFPLLLPLVTFFIKKRTPPPELSSNEIIIGATPDAPLATLKAPATLQDYNTAEEIDTSNNEILEKLSLFLQLDQTPASLLNSISTPTPNGTRIIEITLPDSNWTRSANPPEKLHAFAQNSRRLFARAPLPTTALTGIANLMVFWQMATLLVAQKHIADIAGKLSKIQEDIEKISSFLDSARTARIQAIYDYLGQIYASVNHGDIPPSFRPQLEAAERDLLEIQHHLEASYAHTINAKTTHDELVGTGILKEKIEQKITTLHSLSNDITFCLKTRIASLFLLTLFPDEQRLKQNRWDSVNASIQRLRLLEHSARKEITHAINSISSNWNKKETLRSRKASLRDQYSLHTKKWTTALRSHEEEIQHCARLLSQNTRPLTLLLQLQDGKLVGLRKKP